MYQPVDHVMKMYNTLYCNKTYRDAVERAGGQKYIPDISFANQLTDAALEACGHPFFEGSIARLSFTLSIVGDDVLSGLVAGHLLNFATEDHLRKLGLK